jgi:ACR3 family arsenite efflux pump ArsB
MTLIDADSPEALATVTGVLVEVSVVLSAGKVCSRTWRSKENG